MRVKYENSKAWWEEEVGGFEMGPFPVHASLQCGYRLAERKAGMRDEGVDLVIAGICVPRTRTALRQVSLLEASADSCSSDVVREYQGPAVVLESQMGQLKLLVRDVRRNEFLLLRDPRICGRSVGNHSYANEFISKQATD